MYGWQGTILRIDLTHEKCEKEVLPRDFVIKYLGGGGLNARLLFDEVRSGTDPLGPDNALIIGVGPLVGTIAPSCSRWTITAKAPLSGCFGDTNLGGHFGAELKFAGYDHIIIKGKAKEPVYIWIDNDTVEIRKANHLWGKTVWDCDDELKAELGDDHIKTAIIGPAAEVGIKFGAIIATRYRAGGRGGGMGTVMASKNLKAIAVRGSKTVKVAKPQDLMKLSAEAMIRWREHPLSTYFEENGSLGWVPSYISRGVLPIRCGQTSIVSEQRAENWGTKVLHQKYEVRKTGCFGCFVHCTPFHSIKEGLYAGTVGGKPELPAAICFSAYLDTDSIDFGIFMQDMCNKYGMDCIEVGAVLGMAFYWYQKGLIDKKDTDGLDLVWGNESAAVQLFRKLLKREGLGAVLSLGVKGAVDKMGPEYEPPQGFIKGVGNIMPDFRVSKGWALGAAISPRGADHGKSHVSLEGKAPEVGMQLVGSKKAVDPFIEEDKYLSVAWCQDFKTVVDSVGICKFPTLSIFLGISQDLVAKFFEAVTGVEMTYDQLRIYGERNWNVMRCFNVREGLSRKDDSLPAGVSTVPKPDGVGAGLTVNLDKMLDDYYNFRGWDVRTGIPTQKKLKELGLEDVAGQLV
jgi:aldehyde:ferredoxin oxidoreductase